MKTYKLAAIPGDGIGTEVVAAGIEVLAALAKRDRGFGFNVDRFDWGGEYYKKHGRMMPENGRDLIRKHDAILFGSAGHPDIPDHITLWGLRLAICQPFDQYAQQIAREFPDVRWDKMLVDAMTMRMVMRPATIDTVVATNLHADILSDLAAALAGSLGIAPTANLNPERAFPSMFEPIHGSAFDIMGKV